MNTTRETQSSPCEVAGGLGGLVPPPTQATRYPPEVKHLLLVLLFAVALWLEWGAVIMFLVEGGWPAAIWLGAALVAGATLVVLGRQQTKRGSARRPRSL